jgi:hypothetical protein
MLQLLSPLALAALVSLAIPALLHLWRPPAKTVRIGTLRFFTGPAVRRLTKLQWRERLLLLVRLLLLAMLVLLLARPVWNKPPPTAPQRWILIEPGVVLNGVASERLRAFERQGYETRALASGFPRISSAIARTRDGNSPVDLWSLLREADARLPAGSHIAVITSARIAALRGERPALRAKAELIRTPLPQEAQHALVSVKATGGGELHCIVQSSDGTKTARTRATVPVASGVHRLTAPLDHLSIEVTENAGGNVSARIPDDEWVAVSPDQPLNVLILHAADRSEDARYVAAAIRAITDAQVDVKPLAAGTDVTRAAWIFWLSDEPVPPAINADVAMRGADLLQDAESSRDAHDASGADSMTVDGAQSVALLRRTSATGTGAAIWRDDLGRPLLTVERTGRGRHWRFFSRFHDEWNDLPRSSALPVALRPLLIDNEADRAADLRRADISQVAPAEAPRQDESHSLLRTAAERLELQELFWSLAVLLFAAERALSYRSAGATTARISQRSREEAPVLVGDTR